MTATVLVGRERRRWWTTAQKLLMVEESFSPGASVAAVARRHEVHPNQLHGWRRDVLSGKLSRAGVRVVEITIRDQGCTVARRGKAAADPVPTASARFAPVEITGTDQAVLPSPAARAETELALMIEVVLRNGRLVRFPERIDARRAARLADALDGDER